MNRAFIALLGFTSVACCCATALAQEAPLPLPLDFVRVYAPADRMDEWPLGEEKYVPVEAVEFERLAAIVARGRDGAIATRRVLIEKMHGRAKLANDELRGEVSLQVEHDGGAAALLPLEPWGLAITAARWKSPGDEPAILGVAPDGRTSLVAEHDGQVGIEFASSCERLASGGRRFALQLPAVAAADWEIIAAASDTLQVTGGTILATVEEADARRRYTIESLPGETLELLFMSNEGPPAAAPELSQQNTTYVFANNGVEVIVDLQLDDESPSPLEIGLELDPELKFISAQSGAEALDWRRAPEAAGDVVVRVPAAGEQRRSAVRVTAWCPLRAGVRWRLPRVRARGLTWRDGQVELVIPEPLVLTEVFSAQGMHQSRVSALAAPQAGESHAFDCHAADADLEVRVDQRAPRLRVASGIAVEIGPRETTARTVCDIEVLEGETFALVGRVAPTWLIDDVSSVAGDAVRDFERGPQDDRSITVHLKRGLRAGDSLRLAISARRVNLRNGESASLELFEPIHWERAAAPRRLLSLRSSGEQRWRLTDLENVQAIGRERLTALERELLSVASEETLIALEGSNATGQLLVESRPLVFRAAPVADFTLAPDELKEHYDLNCVPEQGAIDAFLVRFSTRRDSPVKWDCEATIPVAVTAERLEQATPTGDAGGGETWQVRLWPPQTAPFRIRAERRTIADGPTELGLIEVIGATTTQGVARVRAERSFQLHVAAEGPRPSPFTSDETSPPVRAQYHYDPARDVHRAAPAALTATVTPRPSAGAQVLVRKEELEAYWTAEGNWHATASFELEPSGASAWQFRLPDGARLVQVTHGGSPAKFQVTEDRVELQLDPRSPRAEIEVEFTVAAGEPESASLVLPALRLENATHPRSWRVNLPRDWELAAVGAPWRSDQAPRADWRTRLFGPLARTDSEQRFASWEGGVLFQGRDHAQVDHPVYVVTGPSAGVPRLELRRRSAAERSFVLIALLSGAIAWRLGRWRPALFVAVPLALAALALVVSESLIGLASAAFLGSIAAALIAAIRGAYTLAATRHVEIPVSAGSTTHSLVVRVVRLLVIGLGLLASAGHAADVAPAESIYRIFIPVDDEQLPVGDRYFVPPLLWSELRSRAAGLTGELPAWLLTNAEYTAGSVRAPVSELAEIQARYEIRTFAAATEIELNWGAEFFRQAVSIRLDGVSLAQPTGDVLRARIADAGLHRLDITLRPIPAQAPDRGRVTLRFPPHPRSQFNTWLAPGAATQLAVASPGVLERRAAEGRLTIVLGAATELQLPASRAMSAGTVEAPVELEQFVWLTVAPEYVTAEVRHQLVGAERPLRELSFDVDPHWSARLAHSLGPDARCEVDATTGRVRVEWSQPRTVGERFALPLRLESSMGIGEVGFPLVEPLGAVVRRRWCAVTIDPAVEVTSLANTGAGGPTAAQFAAAWGNATTAPDRALNWPVGGSPPTLQTALRRPRSLADERVTWIAHADRLDARLEATIDITKAPLFSHRVHLPSDFVVEEVSVLQEGAQQVAHWTRAEDDALIIFLRRPAFGRQSLELRGRLPVAAETIALPAIGVAADDLSARSVRLYRQRTALVDQLAPPPRAVAQSDEDASLGRLVAEWGLPLSQGALLLRVRPNDPLATAVQVISVRETANVWSARVDLRAQSDQSVIDELRFELPTDWKGPFTLDPAWPYTLSETPGATSRVLTVRPPQAQAGEVQLRIEAPLNSGAEPSPPSVALLGVRRLQRLVALPTRSGDRQVDWLLQNARPAQLPAFWQPSDQGGMSWKCYEVVDGGFSAVRNLDRRPTGTPRIRLADTVVRVEEDGGYRGRIRWELEPGGLQQIPLRLPPGGTVLTCRVLGADVDARRDSAGGWLLPLLSDHFPQEVEVLYAGALDRAATSTLPIPEIPQVTVEASYWSVISSPAWMVSASGDEASSVELAVARYRVAVAQFESGLRDSGFAGGTAPNSSESTSWRHAQLDQLALARATALAALDAMTDRAASRAASVEVEKLDQRMAGALGDNPQLRPAWQASNARAAVAAHDANGEAATPGKRMLRYQGEGGDEPPRLALASTPILASFGRYLVAALLAALAWSFARNPRWSRWGDRAARGAWLWLALAGAAWWLWLTPSALGVLMMGLGAVLLVRQKQPVSRSFVSATVYP